MRAAVTAALVAGASATEAPCTLPPQQFRVNYGAAASEVSGIAEPRTIFSRRP